MSNVNVINTDNTVQPIITTNTVTVVTNETQVSVTTPVTNVVEVIHIGPQGPQGPQGPAGTGGAGTTNTGSLITTASVDLNNLNTITFTKGDTSQFSITIATGSATDITALNNFSGSILTFTSSIQTQVNSLTLATSSYLQLTATASMLEPYVLTSVTSSMLEPYVLTSVTSSMIVSGALTASYVNPLTQNVRVTGSLLLTQSHISTVDYIDFTTNIDQPTSLGRLGWNDSDGTLSLKLKGDNVDLLVGEAEVAYVFNAEGTPLSKGEVVYITGSQGNRIAVKRASNSSEGGSAGTLGFVAETIVNGQTGFVITSGILRKVDTTGYQEGKLVYLSNTPGQYTQTKPAAPQHEVRLGYVERVGNSNQGAIYVKVDNGYEIDELHNVLDTTTTASYGDLFVRSGSLWISGRQLTGSYGLTGSLSFLNGGITGSLFGTASWSSQALTASYVNPTFLSASIAASGFGDITSVTAGNGLTGGGGSGDVTLTLDTSSFTFTNGVTNQVGSSFLRITTFNSWTGSSASRFAGTASYVTGSIFTGTNLAASASRALSSRAGGVNGQVQYNAGGEFAGNSKLTFDGTNFALYNSANTAALLTAGSSYYTKGDLLHTVYMSTGYITEFAAERAGNNTGHILKANVSASEWDLVFLSSSGAWSPVTQTNNTQATRMLGICLETNGGSGNIFIDGYIMVGNSNIVQSTLATTIDGTLSSGAPVYIKQNATNAPFLSTAVPSSGIVRILGHLIRNENTNYWFMKFRPDHTWVEI